MPRVEEREVFAGTAKLEIADLDAVHKLFLSAAGRNCGQSIGKDRWAVAAHLGRNWLSPSLASQSAFSNRSSSGLIGEGGDQTLVHLPSF